jgi:rhamnosyltransferase
VEGILFLDQDSTVAPQSLRRLIASFVAEAEGLGVIGGFPVRSDGQPYRTRALRNGGSQPDLLECRMVPSSFSIIPVRTFKVVGSFHEDFFIDHIDVDFCARCRRAGLRVIADRQATFSHAIGEQSVVAFGKYLCPGAAPFRYYFQFRNCLLSARRGGMTKGSAVYALLKHAAVVALASAILGGGRERLRWSLRGLRDGLLGRSGPLPG